MPPRRLAPPWECYRSPARGPGSVPEREPHPPAGLAVVDGECLLGNDNFIMDLPAGVLVVMGNISANDCNPQLPYTLLIPGGPPANGGGIIDLDTGEFSGGCNTGGIPYAINNVLFEDGTGRQSTLHAEGNCL